MKLNEIKDFIKEQYKDYEIQGLIVYDNKYYVFIGKEEVEFDLPVLTFDIEGEKQNILDRTDKEVFEAINKGEKILFENEEGENNMNQEQKIRKLLKEYGAKDVEIENFMTDLAEMKDEAEEENLLIANADKLKATQEGRELIKHAPETAKDELTRKIKELLNKKEGEF